MLWLSPVQQDGVLEGPEILHLARVFAHIGGNERPSTEDIAKGVPGRMQIFDPAGEGVIKRATFVSAFMVGCAHRIHR